MPSYRGLDLDLFLHQDYSTMRYDYLKYLHEVHLHWRLAQQVPCPSTSVINLDELSEEIWFNQDKADAARVLEAYQDNISNYASELLVQVIFGTEFEIEFEDPEIKFVEKLQKLLDQILF